VGDGPVFIVLHSAVDIRLYNWRTAFHDLARIHTALARVRGAPVDPGTLISNRKKLIFTVGEIIQNS